MTHNNIFSTGIRPAIDDYLLKKSQERRDYGEYWSASSAGYCMRKNIFDRLQVPYTTEDARKQRVFTSGHIFHAWIQEITKESGLSVEQEGELINNTIMVKGHFDDIIDINGKVILYDYKTQNSRAFTWAAKTGRGMSYFHMMQLGTYLYMLRHSEQLIASGSKIRNINEARILKISKDDLRMAEEQLLWTTDLQKVVTQYWNTLNDFWTAFVLEGELPDCTCADQEGGFMAKDKYNPYFYEGQPCSLAWLNKCIDEGSVEVKS